MTNSLVEKKTSIKIRGRANSCDRAIRDLNPARRPDSSVNYYFIYPGLNQTYKTQHEIPVLQNVTIILSFAFIFRLAVLWL